MKSQLPMITAPGVKDTNLPPIQMHALLLQRVSLLFMYGCRTSPLFRRVSAAPSYSSWSPVVSRPVWACCRSKTPGHPDPFRTSSSCTLCCPCKCTMCCEHKDTNVFSIYNTCGMVGGVGRGAGQGGTYRKKRSPEVGLTRRNGGRTQCWRQNPMHTTCISSALF